MKKLNINDIIVRLFIFIFIWTGIFHIYVTILDTNWPIWRDIIGSFLAAFLPLTNKSFNKWFFNLID